MLLYLWIFFCGLGVLLALLNIKVWYGLKDGQRDLNATDMASLGLSLF